MNYITTCPSPVGMLTLTSDGEALTGLWIEGQKYFLSTLRDAAEENGGVDVSSPGGGIASAGFFIL